MKSKHCNSNKKWIYVIVAIVIIIAAIVGYMLFSKIDTDQPITDDVTAPESSQVDESETTDDENISDENSNDENITDDNSDVVDDETGSQGKIKVVANPDDVEVLLNKKNALPDGWEPPDLVNINSNYGGEQYLRQEAAAEWEKLRVASINDGVVISVVSSYRSQKYQEDLYNYYMSFDAANAPSYSAYPRTSEHEAGLAIDISYDGALHDDLQNSSVGSWMNENGWKYGWIMRYPEGKEKITGYIFEPWHYRYVGKDLAKKIHKSGLTMEEYFNK